MANLHWIVKLAIIGIVIGIDYGQGKALVGFALAVLYLLASAYSLIRGDRNMFKKRAFLFAVFAVEVLAIASAVDSPPDLGFLQDWIDRLAGHSYYKTK